MAAAHRLVPVGVEPGDVAVAQHHLRQRLVVARRVQVLVVDARCARAQAVSRSEGWTWTLRDSGGMHSTFGALVVDALCASVQAVRSALYC